MRYISATFRQLVIERAHNRCEYCGLAQTGQAASFHIDHAVPLAESGQKVEDNLALACVSCSLHEAARLTVSDPKTSAEVSIYNPRQHTWSEHFSWDGVRVVGLTPTGRATVEALRMNRPVILATVPKRCTLSVTRHRIVINE